MSLLSGDQTVCAEQAAFTPSPLVRPARRLTGCYYCGDPTVGEWFCAAHLWAEGGHLTVANGLGHITPEHAFWIEKFTPEQIVELGSYIQPVFKCDIDESGGINA